VTPDAYARLLDRATTAEAGLTAVADALGVPSTDPQTLIDKLKERQMNLSLRERLRVSLGMHDPATDDQIMDELHAHLKRLEKLDLFRQAVVDAVAGADDLLAALERKPQLRLQDVRGIVQVLRQWLRGAYDETQEVQP